MNAIDIANFFIDYNNGIYDIIRKKLAIYK